MATITTTLVDYPSRMSLKKRVLITSLFFLAYTSSSHADETYTVSQVYDGDTVELTGANGRLKLRLTDIDAPERNQEFGQKARRALIQLCKGSHIRIDVEFSGKDKYNRHLGRLECNQTNASLYLAQYGYAWFNDKYSDNTAIKNAADTARKNRIGLWSADNPQPPWQWRHQHLNAYPPASQN